jgi:hypothetical protein
VSGVVLLNALGRPEPSPEVSRRLTAIHAGLSLRWVAGTGEHWAICMAWQPEDTRWEHVQNGSYDSRMTYDIIGYLPLDCSVDEAPAYISRAFRQYPKEEVSNIINDIDKWNTSGVGAEHIKQVMQELADNKYGAEDGKVTGRRKRVKPSTE